MPSWPAVWIFFIACMVFATVCLTLAIRQRATHHREYVCITEQPGIMRCHQEWVHD